MALFLCPIASDVTHLHYLLQSFGSATGLCTNIQKLEILLIHHEDIDVPVILGPSQAKLVELPCRYPGLPIRCGHLKREDEQSLIDRVTTKLLTWKGHLLNKAGHLILINSVQSSMVMHHITVFQLSKWALKKIDKI
jgi:hypothetical protein